MMDDTNGTRFYYRDGQVWDGIKSLFHIDDAYNAACAVLALNTQANFTQEYMKIVERLTNDAMATTAFEYEDAETGESIPVPFSELINYASKTDAELADHKQAKHQADRYIAHLEGENARITYLYNDALRLVHDSKGYERMILDGSDHAGVPVDDDEPCSVCNGTGLLSCGVHPGYAWSERCYACFDQEEEVARQAQIMQLADTEATHADSTAEAVE